MLEVIPTVPWLAGDYPIAIAELRSASKDLERLLSERERDQLIDFLAFHPEGGEIMPGTGGVRKTRWPYKGKGKSRGLRIIYYFHDLNIPLYILESTARAKFCGPQKGRNGICANSLRLWCESMLSAPQPRWLNGITRLDYQGGGISNAIRMERNRHVGT